MGTYATNQRESFEPFVKVHPQDTFSCYSCTGRFEGYVMAEDREWFVWNTFKGVVDTASVAETKPWKHGINAHLAEPYGTKVGPISLSDLEKHGRVESNGYVVLSPERWEREREALYTKFSNTKFIAAFGLPNPADAEHRKALSLPLRGPLSKAEIVYVYRNATKTEHPDGGGSGERFRRLTEARDVLLGAL
jgi:hypothetical protein